MSVSISDRIRGRTIRLTWTAGPTQGKTHEHFFHDDGTVEWRAVDSGTASKAAQAAKPAAESSERPACLGRDVGDQVVLVSYLSPRSGYTLTVALDFRNQTVVGVASDGRNWTPVEGTFEVEHQPAVSIGP